MSENGLQVDSDDTHSHVLPEFSGNCQVLHQTQGAFLYSPWTFPYLMAKAQSVLALFSQC